MNSSLHRHAVALNGFAFSTLQFATLARDPATGFAICTVQVRLCVLTVGSCSFAHRAAIELRGRDHEVCRHVRVVIVQFEDHFIHGDNRNLQPRQSEQRRERIDGWARGFGTCISVFGILTPSIKGKRGSGRLSRRQRRQATDVTVAQYCTAGWVTYRSTSVSRRAAPKCSARLPAIGWSSPIKRPLPLSAFLYSWE